MSSIYIPTSSTSVSVTKDYVDQSIQPLAVQLGTATSNNLPNTIVKRDASGYFSANKIRVNNIEPNGTTLNIANDDTTTTVNVGSGTVVQTINVGNSGTGKTTIKLGGGTDEVLVNLPVKDSATSFSILSVTSDASTGNTALGSRAMTSWTGTANTFVGSDIGFLGTGVVGGNTVVGSNAMKWVSTGGNNNCAMGHKSLESLTSGNNNVAIGYRSGFDNGSRNLTSGNQNVLIGAEARTNNSTMNNAIAIGYGSLVDADNTVQLGNTSIVAVKTSGTITAGGLKLPTTGGTVGTLDHYEEYTYTTKFTGPVAPTADMTVKIVRIGKMVTLNMKTPLTFFAQTTSSVYSVTQFPARFFPSTVSPTMFTIPVYYDSDVQFSPGVLKIIENTGTILINGPNDVAFFMNKTSGFGCFSVSWVL